jgi:hypothetical protein
VSERANGSGDGDGEIAELVARFQRCSLVAAKFHHRQHLQVAWWLLREGPPLDAMVRFVDGLRRFAAHIGKPEVYHETITWAYLVLINERLERAGRRRTWAEFARDHAELFTRDFLHGYYAPATLASPLARRVFLFPDATNNSGPAHRTDAPR